MTEASLTCARRDELIENMAFRLRAWQLREPAIVLLALHAPLAFLGSQFLLAAEPLLGVLGRDRLAQDLALLLQDPQNIELLLTRLENDPAPSQT